MTLWVVVVGLMVVAVSALIASAKRARDELSPTVEAFTRFRAALRPAVADLDRATTTARQAIDGARTEILRGR